VTPDFFLAEYGARQFEVTIAPAPALVAADHAVITREMARAAAFRLGYRACFSPMPAAEGVGNGVHIQMSLRDVSGKPAMHHPAAPYGLGEAAAQFCAGVLHHLSAIAAITAPSPVSYLRPTPNRWAPTMIDILHQDRGAAIRVCPVFASRDSEDFAHQYHVEFRVCDAAASPYLALGAVIFAGSDGIARKLALPDPGQGPASLPHSLAEALVAMEASEAVPQWFGPVFRQAYLRHKRSELAHVAGLGVTELCGRYAEIY
jgi:glutamine synthetase